jgi:WD40 repeat protein
LGSDAPGSAARLEFSPDGSLLAFGAFNWEGFVPDFVQTEIWSVDALRVVHEGLGSGADFNVGGLLSFAAQDESGATSIVVFDPESGDTLQTIPVDFDAFFTSWSPNSAQIAVANRFTAAVFDVEEKLEIARADADRVWRPEWLSSGDAFFVGGTSIPKVIDAASGEVRMELRGQAGGTFDYDLVADTYSVASAGFRTSPAGTVIFDTSPPGAAEVAGWESELSGRLVARYVSDGSEVFLGAGDSYLTAHALDGSNSRVTQSSGNPGWFPNVDENGEFVGYATADGPSVVRSLETEAVVYEAPDGWTIRGVSPDRTHAVIKEGGGLDCAPIRLVAIQDDESTDLPIPCIGSAWFSPNGRYMVAGNAVPTGEAVVFDTETAEVVADLAGTPYGGLAGGFTSDSTKMIIGSLDGPVFVLDMATLASEGPVAGAVDLEIPAHDALVIIVRVSPDGSKVATAAFEGPLRVWDLTNNGQLLGEFGEEFFNSGDFHPTEPHLLVASPPNLVRIHSFNLDELIAIAEARLSRDMTAAECDQYFRDPCPTS